MKARQVVAIVLWVLTALSMLGAMMSGNMIGASPFVWFGFFIPAIIGIVLWCTASNHTKQYACPEASEPVEEKCCQQSKRDNKLLMLKLFSILSLIPSVFFNVLSVIISWTNSFFVFLTVISFAFWAVSIFLSGAAIHRSMKNQDNAGGAIGCFVISFIVLFALIVVLIIPSI